MVNVMDGGTNDKSIHIKLLMEVVQEKFKPLPHSRATLFLSFSLCSVYSKPLLSGQHGIMQGVSITKKMPVTEKYVYCV